MNLEIENKKALVTESCFRTCLNAQQLFHLGYCSGQNEGDHGGQGKCKA